MSIGALLNTLGTRCRTLPLVILYVTEGCNLRCISCSYRNPSPGELTLEELARLAVALKRTGLRHIVYSGGEPLLRKDFPAICSLFGYAGVHQTVLTNGLLLEKRFGEVEGLIDEFIVSIDGPDAETHNAIRGVASFDQIARGIRHAVSPGRGTRLSIRTVVQKRNFRTLIDMVRFARDLGAKSISFLAADVLSASFGRDVRGGTGRESDMLLDAGETGELRSVIARMARECRTEFRTGFIAESPGRLLRIAEYFDALAGRGSFPPTSCNAPMVSAVITSSGDLLPCYFLPRYGNIREGPLPRLLNGDGIQRTRSDVRAGTPERCRTCVCTLTVSPARALAGRF